MLGRQPLHRVVVDPLRLRVHPVRHHIEKTPGKIDLVPVGQVSAVRQAHCQHRVARLQNSKIDRHVCAAAAVGLDIRVLRPEQLFCPLNRQPLHFVHEFAAVVVALAGISFRVLVRHHGPLCFAHRPAGVVLRGDQFDVPPLPPHLPLNCRIDIGILLMDGFRLRHPQRAGIDLLHPAVMAAAGFEFRIEPGIENRRQLLQRGHRGAQRHDVGVVVLPRQAGHPHAEDLGGPDPRKLVGRHPHAHARGADQDALSSEPSDTRRATSIAKSG